MSTYYLRTDGNDSNAGTADTAGGAWRTLGKAAGVVTAGDVVMVRGTAGNAASFPTTGLDYTVSSFFTPGAGSASGGFVKWVGLGSVPTIGCPGLTFYLATSQWFEGLYFVATGNGNAGFGVLNLITCVVRGCTLNLNSQASLPGVNGQETDVEGCDIYGGSASPTASSGADGIITGNYGGSIRGNRVRYCRGKGIDTRHSTAITGNQIYGCVGDGIEVTAGSVGVVQVAGNTLHANGGHGVNVSFSNGANLVVIKNNLITNHLGSGKAGIVTATSGSDVRKRWWGFNDVYNCTALYSGVTADTTDLSVDPQYADATNGDFTPVNAALRAAFPGGWIGAVQPVPAAGGGVSGARIFGGF